VLRRDTERRVAAGDEALHESGRNGEGWRTLGCVEYAEASAGSGADVEEASALRKAGGNFVNREGDAGQLGCDRGCDGRILLVDNGEHLERREVIDVFGIRIA